MRNRATEDPHPGEWIIASYPVQSTQCFIYCYGRLNYSTDNCSGVNKIDIIILNVKAVNKIDIIILNVKASLHLNQLQSASSPDWLKLVLLGAFYESAQFINRAAQFLNS